MSLFKKENSKSDTYSFAFLTLRVSDRRNCGYHSFVLQFSVDSLFSTFCSDLSPITIVVRRLYFSQCFRSVHSLASYIQQCILQDLKI